MADDVSWSGWLSDGAGVGGRLWHADLVRLRRQDPTLRLDYVFVATYGRSGSTLVQGVLNALPGYLVRGENRGAVRELHAFHSTCTKEAQRVRAGNGANSPSHPWFGIGGYPEPVALADIRRLVVDTLLRPEPATRVTGYKEIRWVGPDAIEHVDWLREVFPGARFVVNTRDLAAVARSGWWAGDPHARTTLAAMQEQLEAVAGHLGDAAYHVHYDDYVAHPTPLRGLIEWLGESYDATTVANVLATRHAARQPATEMTHPTEETP